MTARPQCPLTLESLTTFLPDFLIEQYARALGVVERDSKVDPVLLVWALILGFPAGAKRTLASLRRRFQQAAGLTVARSSFHARLPRPASMTPVEPPSPAIAVSLPRLPREYVARGRRELAEERLEDRDERIDELEEKDQPKTMPTPGIKEQARKLVDSLPEDATWEDLEYKIFVRRKIENGAASIENEETLSTEEVLEELGLEDA